MRNLTILDRIAFTLVVIGGINWGAIGLFDLNIVSLLFGEMTALSRIIYGLVGLSAIYLLLATISATAPRSTQSESIRTR